MGLEPERWRGAPSELGVVVTDPGQLSAALALIRAGSATAAELFLMDDAVGRAHDPELFRLSEEGCEIALCATDAVERGIEPTPTSVRFGSQYDHARLVAEARRVVFFTDRGCFESGPSEAQPRTVRVRLTRPPEHRKSAQALRTAVGYAGVDLRVVVAVDEVAAALLGPGPQPPGVARAIATLRALDQQVVATAAAPAADVEVSW